jgi:hypothetical protein
MLSVNIKVYKPKILSVVLCESEAWSVTLREEHRFRVPDYGVLRRIFGPMRGGENCDMTSSVIFTFLQILLG